MNFRIEKGISIPNKNSRQYARIKYPFEKMEVGDSFVQTIEKVNEHKKYISRLNSASGFFVKTHQPNWEFSLRVMNNKEIRIWRVR